MADLFSTNVLMKVVEELKTPPSFFLDTYFPQVQLSATEEINFDTISGARRLAPFVLPVVEGQIVQEEGFSAHTIKPAYLKPKTVLNPADALKRTRGERIGGGLSGAERQAVRVASVMDDHIKQVMRRKEWMGAEVMRTGSVTLSGEKYPTQVVDFQRDAELTKALLTVSRWGETGVEPLDDIEDWALLVQQKSGTSVSEITMDVLAWRLFRESTRVKDMLNYRNDTAARFSSKTQTGEGGVYQGSIGNLNFFTYSASYTDDAGTLQPMLPDNTVILGGPGIEGVQAHGAILDDAIGFAAVEYFPKSWVPNDPAFRTVMTQSAPLVVPCNVNASMAVTVR